jgi:hypothetical protein
MDQAQLQQLLQVIRVGGGGHKTSKFLSAEGTEWRIWRRNFEQTIQINAWANKRCQRQASAAMESTVAEFTSDIPSFVQGRNIDIMLDLYKTRFLPAAAGQLAAATVSDGCSNGRRADCRLARKVAHHILKSIPRRGHSKLTVTHQQIRAKAV